MGENQQKDNLELLTTGGVLIPRRSSPSERVDISRCQIQASFSEWEKLNDPGMPQL